MINLDQLDATIHNWFANASNTEAAFRLLLAMVAGGLTGLEREHQGREAGFRTNILVCVGSALAMLVSFHVALMELSPRGHVTITSDPGRIAYGIMAGIGFLGSGVIIRNGTTIRGITTAANLWCMAALGLAIGLGMYVIALECLAIILLVLLVFHRLEHLMPRLHRRRLVIRMAWQTGALDQLMLRLSGPGVRVVDVAMQRNPESNAVDFTLEVTFEGRDNHRKLERELLEATDLHLIAASDD